jgi:hypothetical protein
MSEQIHDTDDETDATTDQADKAVETDHLDDMDDGCGCAEVWEHLSENRDEASADA